MRELEIVVVPSPDRLARNYVHQMVLIEELEKGGCRVEFVERPMSSEPNDQLLLQIRGAVAEYERTLLAERMRRGRLAKYKAGLLLPWTHTPYGLRVDPDRPRDPAGVRLDEAKAAVVAEIFAAYLEPGMSLFGVSRHLREMGVPAPRGGKAWSTATLRGIMTNPVYAGKVYAGRVRYRPPKIRRSATHPIGHPHDSAVPLPAEEWIFVAQVPAVVSQEQFDLAREKLSKNRSFARRNNKANEHLLRALVSCGECMQASIAVAKTFGKNNDRKQRYYVCSGKFNKAQSAPEEKCPSRYAPAEQLDEIVWKDLCEVLTHPESITDALRRAHGGSWLPQELKARQENLRQGRAALGRQLERLTEAYLGEVIPLAEYQRRRKDLEQREEALASQERQLQGQARQRMELAGVADSIEDFCGRVRGGLAEATFEQKRKLVELLIDRVIVTGEEVEIRYVIPTDPSSEQVRFCHLRSDYLNYPTTIPPYRQILRRSLSSDSPGYWEWSSWHRGSELPETRSDRERAACLTEQFPPPLEKNSPPRWEELPLPNRRRLVALVGKLWNARWLQRRAAPWLHGRRVMAMDRLPGTATMPRSEKILSATSNAWLWCTCGSRPSSG